MREQLIQYVELLFAGAGNCEDIKQEILQNTLDRYDDLISEGRVPEAAYRLAITGIGDINEILGTTDKASPVYQVHAANQEIHGKTDTPFKKVLRAIAVGFYILSPMPLFIASDMGRDVVGLCGTLCIVAVATVLIMLGAKKEDDAEQKAEKDLSPEAELRRSMDAMILVIGLAVYFVLSFATNAWYITWLIFPLTGAVKGLVRAVLDLKEASSYEK